MKKRYKIVIGLLLFIALLPLLSLALNPLHKDKDTIRLNLLEYTELGLSKGEVESIISNKLELKPIKYDFGAPLRTARSPDRVIGTSHFATELGSHFSRDCDFCFLFRTYVYAYWAFDNKNKLIDIIVYKETDAL